MLKIWETYDNCIIMFDIEDYNYAQENNKRSSIFNFTVSINTE